MKKIVKFELEEQDALQLLGIVKAFINDPGRHLRDGRLLPANIWVERVKTELENKMSDTLEKIEKMIKGPTNIPLPPNQ